MAAAIRQCLPGAEVLSFPLSDGGDGFSAVLRHHCAGKSIAVEVRDPLGRPVMAEYTVLQNEQVVIEVASACGLQHLKASELDPLNASSFGVGQLIAHALDNGYRRLILGLGGSATNDGGAGMLTALGYWLLDKQGNDILPGGQGLLALENILSSNSHPALSSAEILLASDVTNPLLGSNGASRVFGPQKGASADDVEQLELALSRFDEVASRVQGRSVAGCAGAGAAGGLGAALLGFTSARFTPGFDLVVSLTGFEEMLLRWRPALIITGEGRLDRQTLNGKLPMGVAKTAAKHALPVAVIAGQIELSASEVQRLGFVQNRSLSNSQERMQTVLAEAEPRLFAATQRIIEDFFQAAENPD